MYEENERLIYGPFDRGDGIHVFADPVRVKRRLTKLLDGQPGKVIRRSRDETAPELALEAEERVIAATARAFDLIPFDPETGGGVRDDQAIALLNDFLSWLDQKKTSAATSPTWPPPTGPGSSDPAAPTTQPSWGSC